MSVGFHDGELDVQRRAGVADDAARLVVMVGPGELGPRFTAMFAVAPLAAITGRDHDGRLWISPMIGDPGFISAHSPTRMAVRDGLHPGDPLYGLDEGQPVGLIVMQMEARRRVRINGTLGHVDGGSIEVDVRQAYGNCPQYIHRHEVTTESAGVTADSVEIRTELSDQDMAVIRSVDTFFLGTTHPASGNDASHRGGPAGFVTADRKSVVWPDFPGNNMFNSMGNIAVDPTAALLFIDFGTGRVVQVSGRAQIEWDAPGPTGRQVRLTVDAVVASRLRGLVPA